MIRVLYVDDEPALLATGRLFLEGGGECTVDTVRSGAEALGLLQENTFDIVVSDYQMPRMNGIELLRKIRAGRNPVPFIIFTGRGREEVVIDALNEGADFYLQKGGDPEAQYAELEHKIRIAVKRRHAEEEVREAGERYRSLIAVSDTGAWEYHRDTGYLWCSPEYFSMLGKDPAAFDLSGAPNLKEVWLDLIHPDDREQAGKRFEEYLAAGSQGMYENHFRAEHADGHWVWITSRGRTLRDHAGALTDKTVGTHIDITNLVDAENQIRNQARGLSILNEVITSANQAVNLAGLLRTGLDTTLKLLDYDMGGIYLADQENQTASIVHSRDVPEGFLRSLGPVPLQKPPYDSMFIRGEPLITDHYSELSPEAARSGLHSVASIPLVAGDRIIGALNVGSRTRSTVSAQDRSILLSIGRELGAAIQRMSAEEEARRTTDNLQAFFNTIGEMVFVLDQEGTILRINNEVTKRLGYTGEDLTGKNVLMLHPEDRLAEAGRIVKALVAGTADSCSVPVVAKDGRLVEVETRVTRGWWDDREVLIGVSRDVTERNRAESALKQSEEKYQDLIDHLQDIVWELDRDLRFMYVSPSQEQVLGYTREEVTGRLMTEFLTESSAALVRRSIAARIAHAETAGTENRVFEFEARKKNGENAWLEVSASPVLDSSGTLTGFRGVARDITWRKIAQEELRFSERKFAAAFEASPDPIAITELKTGTVLDINQAFAAWSGYAVDEVRGKTTRDLGFWASPGERDKTIRSLTDKKTIRKEPVTFRTRDGSLRNVLFSARIVEIGGLPCMLSIAEDITTRLQGEAALKASEEKYRRLFGTMRDAFISVDMHGTIIETNAAFNTMLGYTGEDLQRLSFTDLTPERWHAPEAEIVKNQIMARGYSDVYEKEYRRKDGTVFPVELHAFLMKDDDGSPAGMWAIVRDITARKRIIRDLEESRNRFRALTETTSDFIWETDAAGRYTYCSPQAQDLWGYSPEHFMGKTPFELMDPRDRERASGVFRSLADHPAPFRGLETRSRNATGQSVVVETSGVPVFDGNGQLAGFRGITRDITERRQAESALRDREAMLTVLLNAPSYAILLLDRDGRIVNINEAGAQRLGGTVQEMTGRCVYDLIPPETARFRKAMSDRVCATGRPVRFDDVRDGRDVHTEVFPVFSADGATVELVAAFARDVTDQKAMENALIREKEFTRLLIDELPAFYVAIAHDGKVLTMNRALLDALEYTAEEVKGSDYLSSFVPEEDRDSLATVFREMIVAGRTTENVNRIRSRSGKVFVVQWHGTPVQQDGKPGFFIGVGTDITRKRRMEEELKESEAKYRAIAENSFDGIIIHREGKVVYANATAARLLGYENPQPLEGVPVLSLVHPGYREVVTERIRSAAEAVQPALREQFLRRDDTAVDVDVAATPFTWKGLPAVHVVFRDISIQLEAEKARKESEDRFRSISSITSDFAFSCRGSVESGYRIDWMAGSVGEITGYEISELTRMGCWRGIVQEEDLPIFDSRVTGTLPGRSGTCELRIRRRDTTVIWLLCHTECSEDPLNPAGHRLIGACRDITRRKEAESDLRRSEEKYRAIVENSFDGILIGRDGIMVYANATAAKILGADRPESIVGKPALQFIHPDFVGTVTSRMRTATETVQPVLREKFLRVDGEPVAVDVATTPCTWMNSPAIQVVFRDISSQLKAEQALAESEEKFRSIFASENDAIFLVRALDGTILDVNDAACHLYGYTREELLSMKNTDISAEPEETVRAMQDFHQSIPLRLHKKRDGTVFPVDITASRFDLRGEPVFLAAIRDISERIRSENAIRQANRQLTLLTSITRHDLLNNIMAIQGFLAVARKKNVPPELAPVLSSMESAVRSMKSQIEFTRVFKDLGTHEPQWQEPAAVIRNLQVPADLSMLPDLKGVAIYADPLVEKVFSSLLDNTVRHGGHATEVRVSSRTAEEGLVISWEDNGTGIPDDEKMMIFERGYGKNTGLGLFLAREILSITGMKIRETGEFGRGARFEIIVPKDAYRHTPEVRDPE